MSAARSIITFFFVGNLFAASAWAQERGQSDSPGGLTSREVRAVGEFRERHPWQGRLLTETLLYPTAVEKASDRLSEVKVALTYVSGEAREWKLDLQGSQAAGDRSGYLTVSEAYGGGRSLSLGRRRHEWNRADRDWNLGLWQPVFFEDGLRPLEQGLTGVFFKTRAGDFEALLFGSGVFIPTMSSDLGGGGDEPFPTSRWFTSLPERVPVFDRDIALKYRLRRGSLDQLIFQPSAALRLRFRGEAKDGFWMAMAWARKPINALSIKYDAALSFSEAASSAQVDVMPVVHHHDIASLDLGWRQTAGEWGLSVLQDHPLPRPIENEINENQFPTDYYQQEPRPLRLISASWRGRSGSSFLGRPVDWTLLYLRAFAEPTPEVDPEGNIRSSYLPHRLNFTHAVSVQAEFRWSRSLTSKIRYLRDFDQRGSLWMLNHQYSPAARWAVFWGLDILGVDEEESQEKDTRFLNYYRQNDRVYGGLAYVF